MYKKQSEDNENELLNISEKLKELNSQIPDLNNLVCDGRGDPCDDVCGGADCENGCGNSITCTNGAKQQAATAIRNANDTEIALRNKESLANDFIRNVSDFLFMNYDTRIGVSFEKKNWAILNILLYNDLNFRYLKLIRMKLEIWLKKR